MKTTILKRALSLLITAIMLIGILPTAAIPAFAEESEEQPSVDSEGYILIWSYEQLVSVAKNAGSGERYRLATDIYQTDSTNDLMIRVSDYAYFSLDLNGHVLSRSTRSLDSAMILVRDNSTLYIYDSSPEQTGTCIYDISGASGNCSVIDNDGSDVIINGGNYIIEGENIPGSAAVLLGYSGSFTVYDGYFDSTNARDGVSVQLFMNTFTDGPNCIVYGGRFYSKRTCITASCWDNYAKLGVYYPYVFVLGGEFYTRKINGDEYEGNFAYCSNFWGRVIVANGLVPARSLNARDQRYATGTTKTVEKLTGAPGNGWEYATVTPPPRIVSEQMPLGDRLYSLCWRDYLKAARENESYDFWTKYQAEIEAELAKIDGFSVNIFDTEVVLSIEDKEEIDSVRWYVSASPDSDWTELVDYQNITGPVTQDPPKQGETLYYRAVVTRKDGTEYEDIIYVNCEEPEKGSAYDEYRLSFNVTPESEGDTIDLARTVKQSDTFEMSWKVPSYLGEGVVCRPEITVTRPKSNIAPKTYSDSKVTINYSEYPNDVIVNCRLYALIDGSVVYFEKTYNVDVKRVYTATDGCIHCYAAGEDGWDEVVEGGSCSFKIYPKDYYALTDPDALEVYVNGVLVTPDEDGVYTVENVTENLDIYCDGSGFTSYSNLTITANGKTVKEKIFNGGTYTFKTLAEFGATVPEGSTFTGWKIGNKTYQPGETYTVPGGTEIAVNAAYKGLHTITVENGKAYADEAHTIPISAAAEDQVIYIVADPAPEGKVFSYWKEIEISSYGGDGWFGDYASAETTYTVSYSDVVLAPVYETPIDHIVINGMTKPYAGVAIDNSDYSYKWGCSVPANSGYSLGICYWYDITDGEPEFAMSDGDVFQIGHTYRFKAKINLYGDTILAAKEDISVALTGLGADSYTWTISEYSQIYENMVIYFEFTCVEAPTGVVVSGTVTSYGNETDDITIKLFAEGSETADYSTTVKGNTAEYSIENVEFGEYTVIVSKNGHISHTAVIEINEDTAYNISLYLIGDVNVDGAIDSIDLVVLAQMIAASENTIYSDVNGDEAIDSIDLVILAQLIAES
ncbi:MAG: hypothetical protein IJO64_01350 [Clostridia bacterium]|nr:hypothetical protein [Clostridia bacterium]